jgi:predicted transcriptional regulator
MKGDSILYQEHECSAMHKIPNAYPLFRPNDHMACAIENRTNIDAGVLKRLSRMYEAGITIEDISEQLRMDRTMVKTLLKLLGYAAAE